VAAATEATRDTSVRQRHSTGSVRVSESSGRRASQSGGCSSSASVKERLKLLQQVVLMVLPGLQVGCEVMGLACRDPCHICCFDEDSVCSRGVAPTFPAMTCSRRPVDTA
jgi:hypothetical protein